ncbi:MAG: hypothetical protein SFU85_07195 [Candidatus Methylacidiphilales bacterium]|nr:hypothetical protein [Candidatus Methylacidiphilales bacterium]
MPNTHRRPCAGFFLSRTLPLALFLSFAASALADEDPEVLAKGPLHEAFAETVQLNPEAGPVIPTAPPEPVEEIPPEVKPEGNNVLWIPGYWAWDDENNRYLWVSGVWRDTPPGRHWVPGQWHPVSGGHQWISGYWAADTVAVEERRALPPPPSNLDYGPQVSAPSEDHVRIPGSWIWQSRYVWRPGYWSLGRADYCWIPASYAWTPGGYVFVDGYWDYPLVRRGIVFAPVYWSPAPIIVYNQPVRRYSPSVVIQLSFLSDCLFIRPRYHHYYFGNYYDVSFRSGGYYTSFAWFNTHRSCEPIFAHRRWENRRDSRWEQRERDRDEQRRNNPSQRPPDRYIAGQENVFIAEPGKKDRKAMLMAAPVSQMQTQPASLNDQGQKENPKWIKLDDSQRDSLKRQAKEQAKEQKKMREENAERSAENVPVKPAKVKKIQLEEAPILSNGEPVKKEKGRNPSPANSSNPSNNATTGYEPKANREKDKSNQKSEKKRAMDPIAPQTLQPVESSGKERRSSKTQSPFESSSSPPAQIQPQPQIQTPVPVQPSQFSEGSPAKHKNKKKNHKAEDL